MHRNFVRFYDVYDQDAKELEALEESKRKKYLSAKLQEIARDRDRLNELRALKSMDLPKITISDKGLDRMKKDPRVMGSWEKYQNMIIQILKGNAIYPAETIGEFNVSPRAHNPIRMAWTYDKSNNAIEIHDFLYHITPHDYVDNWNTLAEARTIKRKDYAKRKVWGGEDLKDLAA